MCLLFLLLILKTALLVLVKSSNRMCTLTDRASVCRLSGLREHVEELWTRFSTCSLCFFPCLWIGHYAFITYWDIKAKLIKGFKVTSLRGLSVFGCNQDEDQCNVGTKSKRWSAFCSAEIRWAWVPRGPNSPLRSYLSCVCVLQRVVFIKSGRTQHITRRVWS